MLLKEVELLSEAVKKKPKPKKIKMKARPKKTLWYAHQGLWKNDLDMSRKGHKFYKEENEEAIYAMDADQKHCYGCWYLKKNMGVTYHMPRPRHAAIHPRTRILPYE